MEAGTIYAVGSYFTGHGVDGYSTRFEDFTVWPAPKNLFGPVDGEVSHSPDDGRIDGYYSATSIRDGTIEAYFHNPYSPSVGEWSYGFMLRLKGNSFHAVVIQSSGHFQHLMRIDGDSQQLAVRRMSEIHTSYPGRNHVRVLSPTDHKANYTSMAITSPTYSFRDSWTKATYTPSAATSKATPWQAISTQFEDFTIWPLTP